MAFRRAHRVQRAQYHQDRACHLRWSDTPKNISTIVLTHRSLARGDFVVTAEERLATRAFSTCTLTIGRARSQLHNARGLHTNTIVLTDRSLARADFVVTAEERLATRASSTCSLTIGRAKSKLNDAPGFTPWLC